MARVALASTPNGTLWGEKADQTLILLTGATAHVYQHGTSTPVPVYTAETGSTQLTQPLTVNAAGQLPGWCDGPQKVDIVYTIHGVDAPAAETDLIPGDVAYDDMGRALAAEALLTQKVGAVAPPPTGVIVTDKANLLAVLTSWAAAGGTLRLAPGTYKIDASLGTYTPPVGATIEMDPGTVIDFSAAPTGTTCLKIAGTEAASGAGYQALTANVAPGASSVSVADPSTFAAGQIVKLGSQDIFDPGQTNSWCGEINRVAGTSAGTVTFADQVDGPNTYHTASSAYVAVMSMPYRPTVEGGTFLGGGAGSQHVGLQMIRCEAPRVVAVRFENCEERALVLTDCIDWYVEDQHVDGSNYSGTGYGLSINNACQDGLAMGGVYRNCGHAQTCADSSSWAGIPRRNVSIGAHAYNTIRDSFKAHPGTLSWVLDSCWAFSPTDSGFVSYGAGADFINCHVRRPGKYGMYFANSTAFATRLTIENADVEHPTFAGIAVVTEDSPVGAGQLQSHVTITGSVDNASNYALEIKSDDTTPITFTTLSVDLVIRSNLGAQPAVYLQGVSEGDFHFVGTNIKPGTDFISANNVRYSNFRFNATLGGTSTGENGLNAVGCQHLTIAPDSKAIGFAVGAKLDGTTSASTNYAAFESATTRTSGFTSTNTDRYALLTSALTPGASGGGTGVFFVPNATAVPTSNPTGGGIFYIDAGALKYRGSSGTVTTIAPA